MIKFTNYLTELREQAGHTTLITDAIIQHYSDSEDFTQEQLDELHTAIIDTLATTTTDELTLKETGTNTFSTVADAVKFLNAIHTGIQVSRTIHRVNREQKRQPLNSDTIQNILDTLDDELLAGYTKYLSKQTSKQQQTMWQKVFTARNIDKITIRVIEALHLAPGQAGKVRATLQFSIDELINDFSLLNPSEN